MYDDLAGHERVATTMIGRFPRLGEGELVVCVGAIGVEALFIGSPRGVSLGASEETGSPMEIFPHPDHGSVKELCPAAVRMPVGRHSAAKPGSAASLGKPAGASRRLEPRSPGYHPCGSAPKAGYPHTPGRCSASNIEQAAKVLTRPFGNILPVRRLIVLDDDEGRSRRKNRRQDRCPVDYPITMGNPSIFRLGSERCSILSVKRNDTGPEAQ